MRRPRIMPMRGPKRTHATARTLAPLFALTLAGCVVGPNYAGPPAAAPDAAARGRFVRADAGDFHLSPAPGLAQWWVSLGDPVLDGLEADALAHSPDLAAAQGQVRAARAQLVQTRAALFPGANASATYVHARLPGGLLGSTSGGSSGSSSSSSLSSFDFYNLGATASWEPDLFGGTRRQVEAARATIGARAAELADAQVTLTAQVAQSYVNLRDVQMRAWLNGRSSALQAQALALTRQRFAAGTASRLDVERAQTQLSSTNAQSVPLNAQIAAYKDALAVLTGREPGALDTLLDPPPPPGPASAAPPAPPPPPLPPAVVPIGDPAALIAHRPDIRAAERELAASTATIGARRAAMLPALKFTGILGLGGTSIGDVVDPAKFAAILLPQLTWPGLDWGKGRAAVRQAEAQRDVAEAQYRRKVLAALQDAEDSLARFGATRQQLAQLAESQRNAAAAAALNRQRFDAGTSTLIDQLDIERQDYSAQIALEQARAELTIDYIAIHKALGLGWQDGAAERDPPVTPR